MFAKGVLLSAQLQRRWNADSLRISDTGDTLSDVPMTRIKSTSPLSTCRASSNASVSFSPKNVISGWAFGRLLYLTSRARKKFCDRDAHLDNPRWKARLLFVGVVLVLVAFATFPFAGPPGLLLCVGQVAALLALRNLAVHDLRLDLAARHADAAVEARRRRERAVTLKDIANTGERFQGVNVLRVVLGRRGRGCSARA